MNSQLYKKAFMLTCTQHVCLFFLKTNAFHELVTPATTNPTLKFLYIFLFVQISFNKELFANWLIILHFIDSHPVVYSECIKHAIYDWKIKYILVFTVSENKTTFFHLKMYGVRTDYLQCLHLGAFPQSNVCT